MERLSPDKIFNKTFSYVFLKMLMPIASLVVSLIAMKIISAAQGGEVGIVGTVIWLVITIAVAFGLDFFLGYKFKASHMAIVTDAVSVNMIPSDMKEMAKESVEYRFPTCNEFLAYSNMVKGSISQLQKNLNTFDERKMRIPVLGLLLSLLQNFVGMALSFTFDLVLAYTFWRDGKPLYTSASDGVVHYYNSWRRITENVMFLAIEIIVAMFIVFVFVFAIVAAMLAPTYGPIAGGCLGVAVAYFVCKTVKTFINSRLSIQLMQSFFDEAQYAEITADEYALACRASSKYNKLYQKAQSEPQNAPQGEYQGE